jgi:hypothetical protein
MLKINRKTRYLKNKEKILPEAEKMFSRHFAEKSEFKKFFEDLSNKNKNKFLKISFFYYHHWWKLEESFKKDIDDFSLIIFTSIIESAMSDVKYKDFYSWYISECKNKKNNVENLWREYNEEYGSTKKIIYFFEKYLSKDDQSSLENGFKKRNSGEKKFSPCSLKDIAKILYKLRSKFVHDAEYIPIPRGNYNKIDFTNEHRTYRLEDITLDEILNILEKGIVKYFRELTKNK